MKNLTLSIAICSITLHAYCQSWQPTGINDNAIKANGTIFSTYADTLTGFVYVAGQFANSNGMFYVAKWDGNLWSELGTG